MNRKPPLEKLFEEKLCELVRKFKHLYDIISQYYKQLLQKLTKYRP